MLIWKLPDLWYYKHKLQTCASEGFGITKMIKNPFKPQALKHKTQILCVIYSNFYNSPPSSRGSRFLPYFEPFPLGSKLLRNGQSPFHFKGWLNVPDCKEGNEWTISLINEGTTNNGLWRDKMGMNGQCEALKKPICQHYHYFWAGFVVQRKIVKNQIILIIFTTPLAGRAFTFVIATKVNKKARLKKGDCALKHFL